MTGEFEYTGTLVRNAEVRCAVLDGVGTTVPVLRLELELHNAVHTRMHAEQSFKPSEREAAEKAARALRKGQQVVLQAPLIGIELTARHATHIQVIPETAPVQEALL